MKNIINNISHIGDILAIPFLFYYYITFIILKIKQ